MKNLAFNGASTKTFIKKGLLNTLNKSISDGDYLLIQFGHNDQKIDDPNWGTTLSEYQTNLLKFADVARQHNAIPIILSSILRRRYKDNNFINTLGDYPKAANELATKHQIKFADINQITFDALKNMSSEQTRKLFLNVNKSKNYPEGVHDNTHLNPMGAEFVAKLIALELKKLNLPISEDIII